MTSNKSKLWSDAEVEIISQYETTVKSIRQVWLELKAEGYNRTLKAVERKIDAAGFVKPGRFKSGHERVYGYFDIEASNLAADYGIILSWSLKLRGGKVISHCAKPDELLGDDLDKPLLEKLIATVDEYGVDVLVTHWGGPGRYDIPFVIARCLYHNLPWPGHGKLRHIDTHRLAKRILRLSNYRLQTIERFIGLKYKTHIDGVVWLRALQGDADAMKYVVDHNIRDVKSLKKIHLTVEQFSTGNSIIV